MSSKVSYTFFDDHRALRITRENTLFPRATNFRLVVELQGKRVTKRVSGARVLAIHNVSGASSAV